MTIRVSTHNVTQFQYPIVRHFLASETRKSEFWVLELTCQDAQGNVITAEYFTTSPDIFRGFECEYLEVK